MRLRSSAYHRGPIIDWPSTLLFILLSGIGLVMIYSATYTTAVPYSTFFKKQLIGLLTGAGIYYLCAHSDIHTITEGGFWAYWATLLLLCYTIIGGWVGLGARRWINLGFIRFQPSELAKLCLPFFLANHASTLNRFNRHTITGYLWPLSVIGTTFVLVLKQPDLGTALIIGGSGILALWLAGLPRRFFIIAGLSITLCAPLLWHNLRPYQQKRIMVLLGWGDSNNEAYQRDQALIAIGAGQLTGTGFLKGPQNKLLFLPEDHTDFIFAVVAEELGFLGACSLLLLFMFFFLWHLYQLAGIVSITHQVLYLGILCPLALSFIVNVGMVMGLLPIVGIPLPFISYGITHTWIGCASVGMLSNIATNYR